MSLTGPDGLLKQFTKSVLETALNEELTEHLGHEKHRAAEDRDSTNIRNGTRPKIVLTEATGQVQIDVPRDRDGTFEPQIVRKRQRRLTGVDEIRHDGRTQARPLDLVPGRSGKVYADWLKGPNRVEPSRQRTTTVLRPLGLDQLRPHSLVTRTTRAV